MGPESKTWQTYEEVAVHLLNRLSEQFGLNRVEEKQEVEGESGTTWEIDGKGVREGDDAFVILECRRYPSNRVAQEEVGGLAFRISDTGAEGGIIVTPIGLQEGAKKVAEHTDVQTVQLDEDSTTTDYILTFLDRVFIGRSLTDSVGTEDHVSVTVRGPDGEIRDPE